MILSAGRGQPGANHPSGDPTPSCADIQMTKIIAMRRRARNVFATAVLADLHGQLTPFYNDIGRLSIDAELMKGGPSDVGQFQSGYTPTH
jgi:hypothetical protein